MSTTNKNSAIISIIVPFYNQKQYLAECVDSLINQKFKDIEIILVDDGSNDGSEKIAKQYAKDEPRVRYVRQTHKGVGAARNTGINSVKTEFLMFCDSDDWMDPEAIQFLYDKLTKNNADIAITTHRLRAKLNKVIDTKTAIREVLLEYNFTFHLWGKLYHTKLWEGIRFPEGHYYEDVAVGIDVLAKAERVYVSSKHFYHYRNNPKSIISDINPVHRYRDFLHFANNIVEKIETDFAELPPFAQRYYWVAAVKAIMYTGKPKPEYRKILKENAPALLEIGEHSSKHEKFCARFSSTFPYLASVGLIIRKKFKGNNSRAKYRH
ncbi:MAG: glycosyltransferase family 2 protein [Candidatus Saccharimonadales bacterium]